MWVGIDFGTTNSAIALSDKAEVATLRVDAESDDLLPSLLYISNQFEQFVGTPARNRYIERNVDHASQYKPVEVGVIRLDVGGSGGYKEIWQNVTVMVDVLSPGRLIRSIKTGLRTIDYNGTTIFGQNYTVEALIALVLRYLRQSAELTLGEPIRHAVLGRPVKFSHDPLVDSRAEERVRLAAEMAGFQEVSFLAEPIAASYAYHRDFSRPTKAFVFDFGGGTLDLTVAELGGKTPRILASEGVLLGGDDIDKLLLTRLLPHFGQNAQLTFERMDGSRLSQPIPHHVWDSLLDWQTVEEMKHTEAIKLIERAALWNNSTEPQAMKALYDLIHRNLYYQLLREIERVKITLSTQSAETLRFSIGNWHIRESITRAQLEGMLQPHCQQISHAIERVLQQAGLNGEEIEQLVPTGGSSQIPLFQQLLAQRFPRARFATRAERNLLGVTQGLAIYAAERGAKTITPQQIAQARQKTTALPPQGYETNAKNSVAHGVIGFSADDQLRYVTYQQAEQSAELAPPFRLADGTFTSKLGTVIIGSTHQRFVSVTLDEMVAMTDGDNKEQPHRFRLNRSAAESWCMVEKWERPENAPLLILVTYWGNVRLFQRNLIEKPLREQRYWKLDQREKADPPSAFLAARTTSMLLLGSAGGKLVRVPVSEISTRGNRALKLAQTERVWGTVLRLNAQTVAFFADGTAQTVSADSVPIAKASGHAGKALWKDSAPLVGLASLQTGETLRGVTARGKWLTLAWEEATEKNRPILTLAPHDALIRIIP